MEHNNINEEIFKLCEKHDGILNDEVHIYDISLESDDNKTYRVYHKGGHCIDVCRDVDDYDDDFNATSYIYTIYQEWDGFDKMDGQKLLSVLKSL